MAKKTNKPSVCSIIALEIIDFSSKSVTEQPIINAQFNALISHALIDIEQKDRMVIDTDNGATIVCNGAQENVLEDALFIAITIRDEILKTNIESASPLLVHFGINTATVGKNDDVEEGVVEAQRIMQLAATNQILVSNEYHKAASALTQEISAMFEPSADGKGLFAVRLLSVKVAQGKSAAIAVEPDETEELSLAASVFDWTYIIPVLLSLALFFVLYELISLPSEPANVLVETVIEETELVEDGAESTEDGLKKSEVVEKTPVKKKTGETKPKTNKARTATAAEEETTASEQADTTTSAEVAGNNEKSKWDKFKENITQGAEKSECTQAEIAMNQCVQ